MAKNIKTVAGKEPFKKPEKAKELEEQDKQQEIDVQLKLDSTQKIDIVSTIKEMREESIFSRGEWLSIREQSIQQYEGIKEPSVIPWPGHSNISTMITTVACDLLHSKLFPMVWNEASISWEGKEEHDNEIADINKIIMSYATTIDMRLQNKVDDIIHLLVVDGTVAIKLHWRVYWKWVTRRTPKITPNALINTGKPEYDVEYDYVRDERCELEIRPLERVHIPFTSDNSVPRWEDDAEYILDDRWYTLGDLREMKEKGQLDKSVIMDEIENAMDKLPEFTGTEKIRQDSEGSNQPTTTRKEAYKLHCVEGYIKRDINNDKIREQAVFLVAIELEGEKGYLSGKALHDVSRIGRRPWVIRPFLRRPGRVYGKSVPELVRHLHTELDAIHNQRIDAGNRVIGGGGFYRPASGTNPRRLNFGPSTWVPVDDPKNDIYMPTYNIAGLQWSANEEKLVMELIERLTYLTPAMLGKETASRPTARGTLAVIQQGENKFGLIALRVQAIFCDTLTDIRQKYEENMPPWKWERILGKERIKDWPSPEYMAGMYECKMQLDMTATNTEAERQLATMMYQTMAMDPIVMQNPAFMWEIRADYLRVHRREPVEKYIGPRPPTANPKDADDIFTKLEQEENIDIKAANINPAIVLPRLMELKRTERYENFTPEAKFKFNDFVRKLQMKYTDGVYKAVEMGPNANRQGLFAGAGQGGMNQLTPQAQPQVGGQGGQNQTRMF